MRSKSYLLLSILFLISVVPNIQTVHATDSSETKWVLDHVIVGESGETRVHDGERAEGSFEKCDVSQTSIHYHSRQLDHWGADDYTNAIFEFTLPVLPTELVPDQTVEVSASGSGSGYMRAGYFVRTLEFRSDDVGLTGKLSSGEEVQGTFGPYFTIDIDWQVWTGDSWATEVTPIPDSDTVTVQFKAPNCTGVQEFSVGLFIWNSNAYVEWFYRCEVVEPEYGIIEKDGKLYLNSPPDGTLIFSYDDLPEWARSQIIRVGDMAICVGPPDTVAFGDNSVLLNGKPVSRVGDQTAHGGIIEQGSDRIFVNGVPAAFGGGMHICPLVTPPVPHIGGPLVPTSDRDYQKSSYVIIGSDEVLITSLTEDVSRGSFHLNLDNEGFEIGDAVVIGSDSDLAEIALVAEKGSIILDRPLKNSYPTGTQVTKVPTEYAELVLPPTEEELAIAVVDSEVEDLVDEKGIPGFPVISIGLILLVYSHILSKKNISERS